jgi:Uma2 family endonuclease
MRQALREPMTLDEFLEWENRQEMRYEFDGFGPVAMARGTAAYDTIAVNLSAALVPRLRGTRCQARGSNLTVLVTGHIRYPDAFVTCEPVAPDATVAREPVVIFEVVSKGSARRDRIEKNRAYRATASVIHHVMIEQTSLAATVLERRSDAWIDTLVGVGEPISLPSIGIEIPLAELYERVDFAAADDDDE